LACELASDLALNVRDNACPQGQDCERLSISRVGKVRPGLLFRLTFDVDYKSLVIGFADAEDYFALVHALADESSLSCIGRDGHCASGGKQMEGERPSNGHQLLRRIEAVDHTKAAWPQAASERLSREWVFRKMSANPKAHGQCVEV
jgi:hypothetical protein